MENPGQTILAIKIFKRVLVLQLTNSIGKEVSALALLDTFLQKTRKMLLNFTNHKFLYNFYLKESEIPKF